MKSTKARPKDTSSRTPSFRIQHIRDVTSVAIRAAKFLLSSRRFRKSVGEFSTIGCFK